MSVMGDIICGGSADGPVQVSARPQGNGSEAAWRQLFEGFLSAEREATLGAIAASIAHGVNTPLAQIAGSVSLAKDTLRELERLTAGDPRRDDADRARLRAEMQALQEGLRQIHESVTAIANITRSVGLFTLQSEAAEAVEPARALEAAIDLTENIIRHKARLECELGLLPRVQGSEARIGHLLLTTLLGSAQAIPEGDVGRNEIRVHASADGDTVRIEVTDSGAARCDPLLCPRDPAEDTGWNIPPASLALAICRALAAEMGGSLEVTPRERGTRVTIRLKVAAHALSEAAPRPAAPRLQPSEAARGRVLVVDDEAVLLGLMCKILGFDHETVGTADPFDALARIERGERYDVIVCDLMMPGMSGVDLHARIARIAPHVARTMIFLTAGAFTTSARDFLNSGEVTWFEKPIEPGRLREVVRARVSAARQHLDAD